MKNTFIIFIVVGLLCSYNISFGDIYKYTDDKGIVRLTNLYNSEPCQTYGCKLVMKEKLIHKDSTKKLLSVSEKSSSDWVEYNRDKDGEICFYKKGNIDKGKSKYVVQVWEKMVYSDKVKKNLFNYGENMESQLKDGINYHIV